MRTRARQHGWGLAAAGVCLLQGVVMYLLSMRGTFYSDDFLDYGLAHQNPAGLHYLALDNFGHFQPGLRAAYMFFERVLPYDYDVVRIVMVLIDVAAMLALWRLLTLLIGPRTLSLLLLAVFGFSIAMLSANLWLTAGINNLAMLFPLILSVDGHVRWMVHRRVRDLLLAAVPLAVSVTFYEKPLLFGIYLPLLLVFLFARDLRIRTMAVTVLRAWPLWVLDLVLLAPYLYYTLRHPYTAIKPPGGAGAYVDGAARSWFFGVVPNTIGGVHWDDFLGTVTLVPTAAAAALSQVAMGGVIAGTLVLRRRVARWWLFVAVVVVSNAVLVIRFRASVFGTGIATDPRYLLDTGMLLLIATGLAIAEPRIGAHAEDPRWRANPMARALLAVRASPVRRRAIAGVAAAVVLIVFAFPALHQSDRWASQPAVAWLSTLRASLDALPKGPHALWDVDVPGDIVPTDYAPSSHLSAIVGEIDPTMAFGELQPVTYAPTPDGRLVPATYVADAQGTASTTCATGHGGIIPLRLSLDHQVAPGQEFLVLPYTATRGTVIDLVAYDSAGKRSEAGFGPIVLSGQGVTVIRLQPIAIAELEADMLSSGRFCAGSISVGHPALAAH